jgi:hypothetical protein
VESGGIFEAAESPLLSVEQGYRNVLRVRQAISGGMVTLIGLIVDRTLLNELGLGWFLPITLLLVSALAVITLPERSYRRLRYRLTGRILQVLRGWIFHTDTVVPLVRVQHLDVVRGPLDKMFGTATLVVHTAGTHNSIVTLPGLAPERAAEMRDIIRDQVRTDFE